MSKPNITKAIKEVGRFLWDLVAYSRRVKPQAPNPNPQVPPPPVVVTPTPPTPQPPAPEFRTVSPEEMQALVTDGRMGRPRPHVGRQWIELICRYASDPRWGVHQRPNGRVSTDILAFNHGGDPYEIIDVIRAEEAEAVPVFQRHVEIEPGSTFVSVVPRPSPIRAMRRIHTSGQRFVYEDGQPFLWAGATAFDLPVRVREGDLRFADWLQAEGFTLARIVGASRYRTPRELIDTVRDLPACLEQLGDRGLYAEVVIGVDTRDYGMSRDAMRAYTRDVAQICRAFPNTVAEIANENTHGTQEDFLRDGSFLMELVATLDGVTCSAGSTHGGESPDWDQGTYLTHHADRGESPEANADTMKHFQDVTGKPIVDDEALGTAETDQPGRRTADVEYAARQARAAKSRGLGGVTFHCEAGLTANVDVLGDVQREAARRFIAAMRGA